MKPLELWDWQKVDQEFLARHNWTALAAVETGGAKTMLAVEAVRNSGAERVLIVAPKQTHHSAWIPTVERQLGLTARVIGNGRKADREALADFEWGSPGIYLVTPQFLTRADVSRWEGDMLVVDEALALDTPVPTPTGWTTVGEVEVGDYVVSPTGWPTKVTGLTPVRVGDTFRLTTDRGEEIVTDAGHLWVAAPRTHGGTNYLKYREVTTQEMFDRNTVWRIERPEPIVLPEAELPIDPYILGQWLGNGSRSQQHVAVRPEHVVDFIAVRGFAIFNVADMCITGAAGLLSFWSFRAERR